ncbi:hypothetical protein DNTS_011631, partial [Danionella cerebrum]
CCCNMVEESTCKSRTEDVNEDIRTDEDVHMVENVDPESVILKTKENLDTQVQTTQAWMWPVLYLCFYGFMVTNEITPVLTYSYMAVLVPVFLLTDYLRYKPVLILQSCSHVSIWLLLLLGTSLLEMQLMEFFYGITMAARVAYSSYIFSLVPATVYQRVAGFSRSSVLMGVFTSSVLGQMCLSLGDVTYRTLCAVSLGFVISGLLLSFCLPWPKRSMFFNKAHLEVEKKAAAQSELTKMKPEEKDVSGPTYSSSSWMNSVFVQMLKELKNVVKVPSLRLWSLWWVFNSTGYYLVVFYVHILWNKVYPPTENKYVYNGAVEAASTLLGAGTSFAAGYVKIRWSLWSELVIGLITAAQAVLLLIMYMTEEIWVCYVSYILFRGLYQFLVPIAIFQIASSLTKELCALVFGVNTFFGTVLKTIITIVVADKKGLALSVHAQFLVYFCYFSLLTVIYLGCGAFIIICHYRGQRAAAETVEAASATELSPIAVGEAPAAVQNGTGSKT